MSDVLSFAEIEKQHIELLPARTVLSLFSLDGDDTVVGGTICQQSQATPVGLLQAVGIGVTPPQQTCFTPVVTNNS
jgi:hypothetical protein